MRLKKSIVLVGMMGAGKTAVGGQLARMLGVGFLDSDDEIVKAANMSITEIFARDGEAFFREKESRVLTRLLQARPAVLATGGGAFLDEANRQMIGTHGVSVWLDVPVSLLWDRVRHRTNRPLLRTADPRGTLERLHAARGPAYAMADLTVPVRPGNAVETTAQQVVTALEGRGDVFERN